jgi:sugar/nucleoside kinase (ribokinase family)
MDLWIANQRPKLTELIGRIDALVLNDSEARQLSGQSNLVAAGLSIAEQVGRARRSSFVVVKKGEHGSLLFADRRVLALPGYPVRRVVDPTGAGDCFAGAMMGFLAAGGEVSLPALRRAIAYGTVTASVALEDFSLNRLLTTDRAELDARLAEFESMLKF